MHDASTSDKVNPVLKTAYAVVPVSRDVKLNSEGISAFASSLISSSAASSSGSGSYTSVLPTESFWAEEPLHPIPSKHGPKYISEWVFMVSLLNFSFWSELGDTVEQGRFAVTFDDGVDGKGRGASKNWTGYWSLPAAVNRGKTRSVQILPGVRH